MTIANVAISGANGTIDFGRTVVNQITANVNRLISIRFATTGIVNVATPNGLYRAVNVSLGLIKANGFGLFSLKASGISGKFTNSQLQNSNVTITSSTGMFGGGALVLGSNISLNTAVVDSISNTRTNLPASANSAKWAQDNIALLAANASIVNLGILAVTQGGTGLANIYTNGQILIGNTTSGRVVANQILAGVGISMTYGPAAFDITANLVQGQNVAFGYPDASSSRITLSANTPITGNTTQKGIVQLFDSNTSVSLELAGTSNAINTLVRQILSTTGGTSASANRLDVLNIYSTPGTYTWTKGSRTSWIEVTVIGGGAAGQRSNIQPGSIGAPGGGGAFIQAKLSLASLNVKTTALGGNNGNTQTIVIGPTSVSNISGNANNGGTATFGVLPSGNLLTSFGGSVGNVDKILSNVDFSDTSPGAGGTKIVDGTILVADTTYSGGDQNFEWFIGINGKSGSRGISYAPNNIVAGTGGHTGLEAFVGGLDALFGFGGKGGILDPDAVTIANGSPGTGFGSGGGGCATKTGRALGGNGTPALVIIREYTSG